MSRDVDRAMGPPRFSQKGRGLALVRSERLTEMAWASERLPKQILRKMTESLSDCFDGRRARGDVCAWIEVHPLSRP